MLAVELVNALLTVMNDSVNIIINHETTREPHIRCNVNNEPNDADLLIVVVDFLGISHDHL